MCIVYMCMYLLQNGVLEVINLDGSQPKTGDSFHAGNGDGRGGGNSGEGG